MRNTCDNCKWLTYDDISDGWVCYNEDSEYYGDWMDLDHDCDDHEEREEQNE